MLLLFLSIKETCNKNESGEKTVVKKASDHSDYTVDFFKTSSFMVIFFKKSVSFTFNFGWNRRNELEQIFKSKKAKLHSKPAKL